MEKINTYTISESQLLLIANLLNSNGKENLADCELELYNEIKEALNLEESKGWM